MRVIVTGSRDWSSPEIILKALSEAWAVTPRGDEFTILHGDCPTGADAIADKIAGYFGWNVERYPADWDQYRRKAGPLRNNQMIAAGADVCLAFFHENSRGTRHCANAAERAGIPVRRWYEPELGNPPGETSTGGLPTLARRSRSMLVSPISNNRDYMIPRETAGNYPQRAR